jgi:hypothetical protein
MWRLLGAQMSIEATAQSLGRELMQSMRIMSHCVVDQHLSCAECVANSTQHRLQHCDITYVGHFAYIASFLARLGTAHLRHFVNQFVTATFFCNVDYSNAALGRKFSDDFSTTTRAAA